MRIIVMLLCAVFVPFVAAAQTTEASTAPSDLGNLPVPGWAQAIIESFDKPLHPVIGSVASGGGLGFGVGYESPDDTHWYQQAEAMVTVRRYWLLDGEVGRRSLSKRAQIGGFGTLRHMGRLDYFGIGPESAFENRSAFRLRETAVGARGWLQAASAIRVGASVSAYMPQLGRGVSPVVPSIEEVFNPASVPGFDSEPTFGRYRAYVDILHPAMAEPVLLDDSRSYRAAHQFAVEAIRDHTSGRHDFHRWEFGTQHSIPGIRPGQRLTLHGFIATTNRGSDVPFYMMYTLGGAGGLKSFRPDLLGTDGTRATLRGFRSYRFRDRDLLLMQAEYRIPVHKYVHTTVFVDAGQVAPRPSELFSDLRANTGFSLSFVRKGKTLGRMDVGFGGGEKLNLSWTFGGFQN